MFTCIEILIILVSLVSGQEGTRISFWDRNPRRGANCMNETPSEEWFRAAASAHIEWVRLAYDKWDTDKRDFLLGDASDYKGLVEKDLVKLKEVLSWADKYEIKVVVVPLSLPGCRWRQNNDNKPDLRLWEDETYQQQAIRFWCDLAKELKYYSCIVAYDILNEPCPELRTGIEEQTLPGDADRFPVWYSEFQNTPKDLYGFYQRLIKAIREIDRETPIMVESGFYAQPPAYTGWPEKLEDPNVLYSFHIYEPWAFTSANNLQEGGRFEYPGEILFGSDTIWWDRQVLELYLKPFNKWISERSIPVNRVVAAEFGCVRRNKGADNYLEDILTILESNRYHWAFYSFREDGWDGYDYELGTGGLGQEYWEARERGEIPPLPRKDNALFDVIKKRLMVNHK